MHRSRLGTLVIDCQTEDLDEAAAFWAQALGVAPRTPDDPENANYRQLKTPADQPTMLVQRVEHPSRMHLDIETDDIDAEVRRLEQLGAKRVAHVKQWWVMEAPTGQRFCVVRPQRPDFATGANEWP
jgi:predicted enzyme related to lactoylglutathione lyase